MPVIRIAEIPNAGPRAVAASSANIGVPRFGGLTIEPRTAQAAGAAMLSDSSTRRAAASMLSQTLEMDAYTAEARAGMQLGKAVGQIGYFAQQMAEKFSKAKDTADISRAETTMRAAFEKQMNEQLDLPVDKWEENWQRNLDTTRKALAEIKLSNNAAAELMPSYERWSQLSQLQIQNQARKKQIEGFRTDIEANVLMKLADDDLTGAISEVNRAVRDDILTPEEGKLRIARIEDDQKRKAKEDNINRLTAEMNADPDKMLPLFERRSRGEDVPELGDISPVQGATFVSNTRSVLRQRLVEDDDAADQAVLTGEIKNAKELREKFPKLPERRLLAHEKTLSDVYEASPTRWAEIVAARPKLFSEIAAYEAEEDDEGWTKYLAIKDNIHRLLPESERTEFLSDLKAKRRGEKKPLPQAVKDTLSSLSKMVDDGVFGVVDTKKLASTNPEKQNKAANQLLEIGLKHDNVRRQILDWAKKNPDKADDLEQVQGLLRTIMNPTAVQNTIDAVNSLIEERETEKAATDMLNFGGGFPGAAGIPVPMSSSSPPAQAPEEPVPGTTSFRVSAATRDQLPQPTKKAPQISLDFNDVNNASASGAEIVIRKGASQEERAIAENYLSELVSWFASKGVDVPNRGVKTANWQGYEPVNRFHTEPFFAKDAAARDAIIKDAEDAAKRGEPSEYAQLLVRTLGQIPNATFIAPHEQKGNAGAATPDGMSEREFARKYIIPSLELIQRRGQLASN